MNCFRNSGLKFVAAANSQVQRFEGEASSDKSCEVWDLQPKPSTTASDLQVIVTQAFARATSVMEICPKLANELFLLHSPTPGKPLKISPKYSSTSKKYY